MRLSEMVKSFVSGVNARADGCFIKCAKLEDDPSGGYGTICLQILISDVGLTLHDFARVLERGVAKPLSYAEHRLLGEPAGPVRWIYG
jgi:hypothetical protein